MKWSVGTKISTGYALALIILVIFGGASYWSTVGFIKASEMKSHTYQTLESLESVLSILKDARLVNAATFLPEKIGISSHI